MGQFFEKKQGYSFRYVNSPGYDMKSLVLCLDLNLKSIF